MAQEFPLVYCAVLNLNARDLLFETLDSLTKMTYPHFKTVVVDNGSTDGSQEIVRAAFPRVELVENGTNLGVMEGYNAGLKYGLQQGADWVLLLNNDIRVDKEMLSAMMEAAQPRQQVGIVAPKIYYDAQPNTLWFAGGRVNYFTGIISHRGIRKIDRGQYDHTEETDYITGCAMLIRREVIERIGLLDTIFSPMYSEDADYSLRARRAGYKLLYVPQAKLWHKVSAFSGGGLTPLKTSLKVEHNLIVLKRYARWYHWLTIPWCVAFVGMGFLIQQLAQGNFKIVGALVKGFSKAALRLRS